MGHSIFEELRNDNTTIHTQPSVNDDEPNTFYATITDASDSDATPPKVQTDTMRILDF